MSRSSMKLIKSCRSYCHSSNLEHPRDDTMKRKFVFLQKTHHPDFAGQHILWTPSAARIFSSYRSSSSVAWSVYFGTIYLRYQQRISIFIGTATLLLGVLSVFSNCRNKDPISLNCDDRNRHVEAHPRYIIERTSIKLVSVSSHILIVETIYQKLIAKRIG